MSDERYTAEDVVAVCVDCWGIIPDSVAERDPFIQQGVPAACMYCGGPVIVTDRSAIPSMKAKRESGGTLI